MVLLGKTGSGKSAAGNTILGENTFHVKLSSKSVTSQCEKQESTEFGRKISVVDTPGLFDTEMTGDKLKSIIEQCVELSVPGPHVFLLVIRLDVRFTEEERNAVKWIQKNFGEDAFKHTIVLFTHADALKTQSIEQHVQECQLLEHLVESCAGGYHSFNNVNSGDRSQVQKLVDKIDDVVRKYYTNEMYKRAQEELKREEQRKKEEKERKKREELQKIIDASHRNTGHVDLGVAGRLCNGGINLINEITAAFKTIAIFGVAVLAMPKKIQDICTSSAALMLFFFTLGVGFGWTLQKLKPRGFFLMFY